MPFSRKSGGTFSAIATPRRKSGGNTTLTFARRRSGGTWVDMLVSVFFQATSQADFVFSPTNARANIRITSSKVQGGNGASPTWADKFTWLLAGTYTDYEFRATHNSGTTATGTFGSYNDAGTAQTEWYLPRTVLGAVQSVFTVDCRRKSDSAAMGSFVVTLDAEKL